MATRADNLTSKLTAPPHRRGKQDLIGTAARRQLVLEKKQQGWGYLRIADWLVKAHGEDALPNGYNAAYACKDLSRELERMRGQNSEILENVRELEISRCDELLGGIWRTAVGGDIPAGHLVLRILERRARYLPIEVPDQLKVGGLEGCPIETKSVNLNDILDALPDDFRRDVFAALNRSVRQ